MWDFFFCNGARIEQKTRRKSYVRRNVFYYAIEELRHKYLNFEDEYVKGMRLTNQGRYSLDNDSLGELLSLQDYRHRRLT